MNTSSVHGEVWSLFSSATIVCTAAVLLLTSLVLQRLYYRRSLGELPNGLVHPPCLPWLPFVGSAPFMIRSFEDLIGCNFMNTLPTFFLDKSKQFGNVIAFYSMSSYAVVLNGRKTINDAFVKKAVAFADRKPFAGEQLIANQKLKGIAACPYNNDLIKRRNLTLSLLKDLGYGKRGLELNIQDGMDRFITEADKTQGRPFDPTSLIRQFVGGIIISLIFGRHFEASEPVHEQIDSLIQQYFAVNAAMYEMVPPLRLLPRYRALGKSFTATFEKFYQLLKQEVSVCLSNKNEESFTYKYAEKEGSDSVYGEDFLFIIRDLLLAGTDSTLQTIRWLLVMLANHNDIQQRLQIEVDNLYSNDGKRQPSLEDAGKLPLVTATILETMRVETLAPLSIPHQTLCDTDVAGFFIPKGTLVFANLYSGHMDPDDWENPTEFRPDRFIDFDGKLVGQELLIAFSMGKRACIGEHLARSELFIFLASLLRKFQVLPPEGQPSVVTERECGIVVQPSRYEIRLQSRQ